MLVPGEKLDPAVTDPELVEAVSNHIERHLGPVDTVLHELISHKVHLDVMVVNPTNERPFYSLVTCGMSARPMPDPGIKSGDNDYRYAELMICLPYNWPPAGVVSSEHEAFWPIHYMKTIAMRAHCGLKCVLPENTYPNEANAEPFAPGTKLGCWMMVYPVTAPEEFHTLKHRGRVINFYAMVALHRDEMEKKLKEGASSLYDDFYKHQVSEILNPGRKSVLGGKGLGWFGRKR